MTRQCKDSFTMPPTSTFLALLTEGDDFKILCQALTLEDQRISVLAAEAKELGERMVDGEKTDAAAKTTSHGRWKQRATAADK